MPTKSKFQRWTPSERAAMTRSELLVAVLICERGMESRRARGRDDWPDREDFWEIHGEWCQLFSEIYARDVALIARWDSAFPSAVGAKPALLKSRRKPDGNDNGKLF
jgi:hypothetical protein